jgi:Sap, sulfolipid-1-addressing protein
MGQVIRDLTPVALGAVFAAPIAVVASGLVMSAAQKPLAAGAGFVLGAALLALIFDGIAVAIFRHVGVHAHTQAKATIEIILGLLFILDGLRALIVHRHSTGGPRERLRSIAGRGWVALLLAGAAIQLVNIDALTISLAGAQTIAFGDLALGGRILALVYLVALMLILYWLPLLAFLLVRGRTERALHWLDGWFAAHERLVEAGTGLLIGALFLSAGLAE